MHTPILTPKAEIETRIANLQEGLAQAGLDAALIIHHVNLFYYSGTSQGGHLFVPREGEPLLMIRRSLDRARAESPLTQILDVRSLKALPGVLADHGFAADKLKSLGLELDVLPFNLYGSYARLFQEAALSDLSPAIKQQRMRKSAWEIERLRASAAVLDAVFAETPTWLREGMTELDLAALFEAGLRRRGYSGGLKMRAFNQNFFMGNAHCGASAAVPSFFDGPVGGAGTGPANNPQGAGWKRLVKNEPIYVDYGCVVDGYTTDETRMFCLGEMPAKLRAAYETALSIEAAILDKARPGAIWEDLYQLALDRAEQAGLSENFMGMGQDRVRFVGHGVGLELDEMPVLAKGLKQALEPGMVFALEPKFVFPEGAVGIENTHLVTESGVETLTRANRDIVCVA